MTKWRIDVEMTSKDYTYLEDALYDTEFTLSVSDDIFTASLDMTAQNSLECSLQVAKRLEKLGLGYERLKIEYIGEK